MDPLTRLLTELPQNASQSRPRPREASSMSMSPAPDAEVTTVREARSTIEPTRMPLAVVAVLAHPSDSVRNSVDRVGVTNAVRVLLRPADRAVCRCRHVLPLRVRRRWLCRSYWCRRPRRPLSCSCGSRRGVVSDALGAGSPRGSRRRPAPVLELGEQAAAGVADLEGRSWPSGPVSPPRVRRPANPVGWPVRRRWVPGRCRPGAGDCGGTSMIR